MADWSNLCQDLLKKISDSFLDTEDLDYYTAFRFVCREWRRATTKPTLDDRRFTASKWMMLKREEDNFLSYVNLSTGRFLRKRLPCLRDFFFMGAATGSGLLVVGERAPPYETRVLNPFTGAMARFRAPIPEDKVRAVVVVPSSPVMVFVSSIDSYVFSWIDQSSGSFEQGQFRPREPDWCMDSHMALFGGEVHVNGESGCIISSRALTEAEAIAVAGEEEEEGAQFAFVHEQQRSARTITMDTAIVSPTSLEDSDNYRYYLVESLGQLLLVRARPRYFTEPAVYEVDTANKAIVPMKSIGGRAIFVSNFRCFSVDASKFPTVQAGSIYCAFPDSVVSYEYEGLTRSSQWLPEDLGTECPRCCYRPLTLPQFFASHCKEDVGQMSELEMMLYYGDVE